MCLVKAIEETYDKYESLYQEGQSNYDGRTFVTQAVIQLLNSGDYCGFITRRNDARKNLEDNITVDEARRIVMRDLSRSYYNLSQDIVKTFVSHYVDYVLQQEKRKSL